MRIRWTTKIVLFKREQSSAGHEQCPSRNGYRFPMDPAGLVPSVEPVVGTERSPDMDGTAGTVIIGAGQVGLAMSWCLRDRPPLPDRRGRANVAAQRVIHPPRISGLIPR